MQIKLCNSLLQGAALEGKVIIIPQIEQVNRSSMRWFENYRAKNCWGMQVTTDILPNGYVRVQVPGENIDVTYNPLNKKAKKEWADDWFIQGGRFD